MLPCVRGRFSMARGLVADLQSAATPPSARSRRSNTGASSFREAGRLADSLAGRLRGGRPLRRSLACGRFPRCCRRDTLPLCPDGRPLGRRLLRRRRPSRHSRPRSFACGRFPPCCLRDTLPRRANARLASRLLLLLRRPTRDGSPRPSRASRVRVTDDRDGPRSGNKNGLFTRHPLHRHEATPDLDHNAGSRDPVHLGAHNLNLVTNCWHDSLPHELVGHIPRHQRPARGTSKRY